MCLGSAGPIHVLEETQGVMGTDICAKEATRDSDRHSMAKGDINALGRENYANNIGKGGAALCPAAAWERRVEHWRVSKGCLSHSTSSAHWGPSSHPRQGSPFVGTGFEPLTALPVIFQLPNYMVSTVRSGGLSSPQPGGKRQRLSCFLLL